LINIERKAKNKSSSVKWRAPVANPQAKPKFAARAYISQYTNDNKKGIKLSQRLKLEHYFTSKTR